jgi:hypothetical protein
VLDYGDVAVVSKVEGYTSLLGYLLQCDAQVTDNDGRELMRKVSGCMTPPPFVHPEDRFHILKGIVRVRTKVFISCPVYSRLSLSPTKQGEHRI